MEIEHGECSADSRDIFPIPESSTPRQQQHHHQSPPILLPVNHTATGEDPNNNHHSSGGRSRLLSQEDNGNDDKNHKSGNSMAAATTTIFDVTRVVRYSMTLLLVLFVSAAILSIRSTQQYTFIVIVIWILLLSLFIAFCYMIDETILQVVADPHRRQQQSRRSRRTVFHPFLHTIHDYIVKGMTDFVDDCVTEYRFLHTMIEDDTNDPDHTAATTGSASVPPPRRTKTRFFRAVVQPILRFQWRRKRGHHHYDQRTQPPSSTVDTNGISDGNRTNEYVPPLI